MVKTLVCQQRACVVCNLCAVRSFGCACLRAKFRAAGLRSFASPHGTQHTAHRTAQHAARGTAHGTRHMAPRPGRQCTQRLRALPALTSVTVRGRKLVPRGARTLAKLRDIPTLRRLELDLAGDQLPPFALLARDQVTPW